MYGAIPDARSATFDLWRDYDDIRISDVAYYLSLNHSRLVVSSLRWRPDLKQDIQVRRVALLLKVYAPPARTFQNEIRGALNVLYNDIIDTESWKQYVRIETADAIEDIWNDAKPHVQDFLDDLK